MRLLAATVVSLTFAVSNLAVPLTTSAFVSTTGTDFTLNGAVFPVVGSNSYWVGLTGLNATEINQAFKDIVATGATVVRTWGFNEVTTIPTYGAYYQSWNGSTPTVNTGPTGLGNFDNIVASASAHGLRLIVTLTNNWADYGGMDVYVNQTIGPGFPHDLFYTDKRIISAYKKYVKTFVSRYRKNPAIFAWELANEPRCKGSTGVTSGNCTTQTITNWATHMSAYIKHIDKNHLVAIGDEGFFNNPGDPSIPYQGVDGIDFNANLAICSIDFGTFHLYPESWGQSDPVNWGSKWITDHAASQKAAGKPTLLEEFGVLNSQATTYATWLSTVLSTNVTGDLIWQAGSHFPSGFSSPNDGYTIYPESPVYPLLTSHAASIKGR